MKQHLVFEHLAHMAVALFMIAVCYGLTMYNLQHTASTSSEGNYPGGPELKEIQKTCILYSVFYVL